MTISLIVTAVILLLIYIIKETKKPSNYPPGPSWIPFVGNLPELKKLSRALGGQHLALSELSKKYKTNVLGLKLGKEYIVTVFSYSVVKKVCVGEEYEGRPHNFFLKLRSMGTGKGITGTDGELWNIQRKFLTTHLKNLGLGKMSMEFMIKKEISEILTIIKGNSDTVQIGKILAPAVINILWTLVSGSRINRQDPRLNKLLHLLKLRGRAFDMSGGTLTQYPWLRFIAPEGTGYNLIKKLNNELKSFLLETIMEHQETWAEGKNDDYIYSFITEMKKANGHKTTFTEDQLIMVCLDIFIAGSQTTSNTLGFVFLMMIVHPDIQNKVHAILDQAFDKSEEINYSDRDRVPYIEAVLLEVERHCHVIPISGPRRALRDTVLEGYYIPKDTTILSSLYSVHNDKSYWKDPEIFNPDRFLDEHGKLLRQDNFIPFGLGKRRCLGDTLAKHCIFVFFIDIIRKYEISVSPGTKKPTGIPIPGISLSPESYRAKFTIRK